VLDSSRTLLILVLSAVACMSGQTVITASPSISRGGQPITLTWSVSGVESVYITGLGRRPPAGTISFNPVRSQEITVVGQRGQEMVTATVPIKVAEDSRGDETIDLSGFTKAREGAADFADFAAFLDAVFTTLQDQMRLAVSRYDEPRRRFLFVTAPVQQADLKRPDESAIAGRRLALLVSVDPPDLHARRATYQIQARLDYRRRGEGIWRTDNDEQIRRRQCDLFDARLHQSLSHPVAR
jgi:hypothetical protein